MARKVIFEWEGREYEHNPKSADWYWALGIVAVAGSVASILFANYLLVVLIVVAAVTISLHGTKHPPLHRFRVVEHGLIIGEELFHFEHMVSFSVLEDIDGTFPPLLSIHNDSWLSPHLMVPLEGVDADAVYEYFLHHVDEGKHTHTFTDLVAVWLGF
jgi:hypothetical protein